ncbi:MAG: cupin domain-containing protein [Candidatus Poribacteria bacterium]|nr:cupin domain-containing protein [Candidatus Poribacteria bacterium]
MPIIAWEDAPSRPRANDPDGFFKPFVNKETGAARLQMHVSCVGAGKRAHPPHKHAEEEIIYVLDGRGIVQLDDERTEVEPNAAVFIPSWVFHGIESAGDGPLRYMVILEPKREESG